MALYFKSLWTGLRVLTINMSFFCYLSVLVFSFILAKKNYKKAADSKVITEPFVGMLSIGFFCFVGHFVLLPVSWDRFCTGIYMIGVFSLFFILGEYKKIQVKIAQLSS